MYNDTNNNSTIWRQCWYLESFGGIVFPWYLVKVHQCSLGAPSHRDHRKREGGIGATKAVIWTTCSLASISRSYDLDCLSSSVRHQRRWLSLGKGSQIRSADRCWQCAWLFSSAGNAPYEDKVNVCQSFSEWTPKENYEASNFRTIWVDRKLWHVFLALNLFGIWKTDENWWSCGPLRSKEWSPDAGLMVVLENGILKQMTFDQSESTLSCGMSFWTLIYLKFGKQMRIDWALVRYVAKKWSPEAELIRLLYEYEEFRSNRLSNNLSRQKVLTYYSGLGTTQNCWNRQELIELWPNMWWRNDSCRPCSALAIHETWDVLQ
jgi:hypothetical protein